MEKTIQVNVKWLEGLLEEAEKVTPLSELPSPQSYSVREMKISSLIGYIRSVRHILTTPN